MFHLLEILLVINYVNAIQYPLDSSTPTNKPQIPTDISIEYPSKIPGIVNSNFHLNNKSLVVLLFFEEAAIAVEGRFIIADGKSDHLFRPYDFIKGEAIPLTEDHPKNDEIR